MMRRALIIAFLVALTNPSALRAGTVEQTCRKAVNKGAASLFKQTLKGAQSCLKTRIKTSGATTDCLGDPMLLDPSGKLAAATSKLAGAMGPAGGCGSLGALFGPVCTAPPAACAAACVSCATGAAAAQCLACKVVELGKAQLTAVYGDPPDLSTNAPAQTCQNTLGKETGKYALARMKAQQKCQQDVGSHKLRASCTSIDIKGKIAKASAKATAKLLKKCLPTPTSDQITALDTTAACLGDSAAMAAGCAITTANGTVDSIFALATKPASVSGFVMGMTAARGLVPLPGARVEVTGTDVGQLVDQNGAYRLSGIAPGTAMVAFDGQRIGSYPRIVMGLPVSMVGETAMGIFVMPEIDMAHAVDVTAMSNANPGGSRTLTAPVTLTNPTLPGAALDMSIGTVLTFDLPNRAPLITMSMVPVNVMPFPAGGVFSDQIFSFQPENTTISPAAAVTFPNNTPLGDGSMVNIYVPDFATNTFNMAGTGVVGSGGTLVHSNGPVVSTFDWHFIAPPPTGCITTVEGRVIDQVTLQPVAGASVLVQGASTLSAADGTFSFPNISCAPVADVSASAVVPNGLAVGYAVAPTVFFGTTNVGDVEIYAPLCGDQVVQSPEECDDGNHTAGDGCSPVCRIEQCGNGIVDAGEQCDTTPGCTRFCTICGDGLLRIPGEECDLGPQNGVPGSGCSTNCRITVCGNGVVEDGETCDDGGANGGANDPCGAQCQFLAGTGTTMAAVRAPLPCGEDDPAYPTPQPTPNTFVDNGAAPACAPVVLVSDAFSFGPAGSGLLTAGLAAGGSDVVITGTLSDVRDGGNAAITSAAGWTLQATVRLTLLGASVGLDDMTVVDSTVSAPMVLGAPGELTGSASVVAAFPASLYGGFARHNVEIVALGIADPNGDLFAVPGVVADAPSQLASDRPASASGGKLSLVQAYVSCKIPTLTQQGVAGCGSPSTFSPWHFDALGKGSVTLGASANDITMGATVSVLLDNVTPAFGGASVRVDVRDSIIDPTAGEATVVTFPARVSMNVANGAASAQSSLNTWLQQQGVTPFAHQQMALSRRYYVELLDNQDRLVAVPGVQQ